MKKNHEICVVPAIPKHIRFKNFNQDLPVDLDDLIKISAEKGKVTKKDLSQLVAAKHAKSGKNNH